MSLLTPRGTPGALALGPGQLYIAGLGTTEPTDLTTAWAAVSANWVMLGYTDAASEFLYQPATADVDVAEELDPISTQTTGRVSMLRFSLAQLTATNLKRALNGGVITTPGGGIVTFEPPDLGTEVRTMLGWEAEDSTERWIYRQCFQQGNITITRGKGAVKALIPCEFKLEKPVSGARLFRTIMASANRA